MAQKIVRLIATLNAEGFRHTAHEHTVEKETPKFHFVRGGFVSRIAKESMGNMNVDATRTYYATAEVWCFEGEVPAYLNSMKQEMVEELRQGIQKIQTMLEKIQ